MGGGRRRSLEREDMRIASIIDISLVDVPGIPVTVIFTGGCNFDCPYCQNASLIPTTSGVETPIPEIVARATGHLSDGFCITGGEPTVQSDLPDLLRALKATSGGHINLNTQGSVPSTLRESLPYLDSVWFDMKAAPSRYQEVVRTRSDPWGRVRESIEMVLASDVEFWPRTTYVSGLITPEDISEVVQLLDRLGFSGRYLVQNYIASAGVRTEEAATLSTPTKEEMEALRTLGSGSVRVDIQWNEVVLSA